MPLNSPKLIQISSFTQGLLWLLLLFPISLVYRNILTDHLLLSWGVLMAAGLAGISLIVTRIEGRDLQTNLTDLLTVGYAGYILFNVFVVRPYPIPDAFWLKFTTVILVYLSIRLIDDRQKNITLAIIAIAGFSEAFFIILQQLGLLASRHLIFNFTGSFFTPALAGGFIACSLCIFIYFLEKVGNYWTKIILASGIALLAYALFLTNSRAGWLAALSGIIFLLCNSENKLILHGISEIKKRNSLKILLFLVFLGSILFIYQYKQSSADGRLFIWQNSLEMMKDKPLTGHGIGMFRSKYPYYQANFFRKNPDSEQAMIAGNPSTPFNEYLSALTMQGILGFVFLTAILIALFLYKTSSPSQQKQKALLLTFCVFAFFSYPTKDFRLLILLPLFAGILPSAEVKCNRRLAVLFISTIILFGTFYGIKTMHEYRKLEVSYRSHLPITEQQYNKIKYDITLLQKYHTCSEHQLDSSKKCLIMKDYVELYPSSYGLCELGKSYKTWNKSDQARECFVLASYINPSLIIPNYELFLLYQAKGDKKNMKKTGEKILKQPIKKESTTSLKIKAYIRKIMSELEKSSSL